jgi:hypothetical protein
VASDFLKVQRDIVEENYSHMRGIARYLFEKDSAKTKVQDAVKKVNPQTIIGHGYVRVSSSRFY